MQDLWVAIQTAVRRFHEDENGLTVLEIVLLLLLAFIVIIALFTFWDKIFTATNEKLDVILDNAEKQK